MNTQSPETKESPLKKAFLRIAFIIGIALSIILLALAVSRFLPPLFSYVSSKSSTLWSSFFKKDAALHLTSSASAVRSGEQFTLTWESSTSTVSSSLSYECTDDLSLVYLGSNSTRIPMPCDRQFKIGGDNDSAVLIPTLSKEDIFRDLEIRVVAETASRENLEAATTITVSAKGTSTATTATSTPTMKPATVAPTLSEKPRPAPSSYIPAYAPVQSIYAGPADLSVHTLIYRGGVLPQVEFTVTNLGGSYTGPWRLSASLPHNDKLFESPDQLSLAPLQSATYVLSLGSATVHGSYSFVIFVDAANQVTESNEQNNSASLPISVTGGTADGKADLTVRHLSTREISRDQVEIRFEVRNEGGTTAKDWKFEATLPTDDEESFESKKQNDLLPGGRIEYTIQFDNLSSGDYFEVEVDSEDEVNESNERNNDIRVRVTN